MVDARGFSFDLFISTHGLGNRSFILLSYRVSARKYTRAGALLHLEKEPKTHNTTQKHRSSRDEHGEKTGNFRPFFSVKFN